MGTVVFLFSRFLCPYSGKGFDGPDDNDFIILIQFIISLGYVFKRRLPILFYGDDLYIEPIGQVDGAKCLACKFVDGHFPDNHLRIKRKPFNKHLKAPG